MESRKPAIPVVGELPKSFKMTELGPPAGGVGGGEAWCAFRNTARKGPFAEGTGGRKKAAVLAHSQRAMGPGRLERP